MNTLSLPIGGTKVILQRTIPQDIKTIMEFERLNRPFVHEYTQDKHLNLLSNSGCLHLSIFSTKEKVLVGHMICFGLDNPNLVMEFRRIAINQKGRGYGREAIQLLKKLCFEHLRFHRLWLDVYDDNKKAIPLYESEGFIYEGTLRDCQRKENGYRSLRVYSMLEGEYIKQ